MVFVFDLDVDAAVALLFDIAVDFTAFLEFSFIGTLTFCSTLGKSRL